MIRLCNLWFALFLLPVALGAQYVGNQPFAQERGGLLINEVSNGPNGVKEYIELVVTGAPANPTAPVDLQGYILDDNNFAAAGVGNAQGHLIFGDCYGAVPPGAILVVYNAGDPNPSLPPDDPEDSDGDGVYIIPHNTDCIDGCNSNPSTFSPLYCPCTEPAAQLSSWQVGLRNPGDVVQVRDRCETVVQAIYWGSIMLAPEIADNPISFELPNDTQSGRVARLLNTVDNNWLNPANYDNPTVAGNETPGAPNSAANADFIQALADGTLSYGGEIADCQDTDAGDITPPADAASPQPPLQLCLGQDLAAFGAGYDQPDEMTPDATGFNFEYAWILTGNDAPDYTIIDYRLDGDFDFSELAPGTYVVWGYSYIQTNGSITIEDFLNSAPATIADILAYDACGYDGDIDNLDPSGEPMVVIINEVPSFLPVFIPGQCADENGEATFDLTQYNETINAGTGLPVTWYESPLPLTPIPDPASFQTGGGSVAAIVSNGVCESPPYFIDLIVTAPPEISAEVQNISCAGEEDGSITITLDGGTDPFLFDWSDDLYDNLANPAELGPGTYSVTVSDNNGCTDSLELTVTEPPKLTLACSVVEDASQPGAANGVGAAEWTGGVGPYELSWGGPAAGSASIPDPTTYEITDLPPGDYELLITDANGCTEVCNFTIEVGGCGLVLGFTVDSLDCAGDKDGALTLNISGGVPPYSPPEWSTGAEGDRITDLSAGVYGVTVSDAGGCIDSLSVTLTEPEPLFFSLTPTSPLCFGDNDGQLIVNSVAGGTPPYTYALGEVSPLPFPPLPLRLDSLLPGNYEFHVRDARGCVLTESFSLMSPPQRTVSLGDDETIALGESFLLSGNPNFVPDSIAWTPDSLSGLTTTIRPIASDNYSLTVFDANGCAASDTVFIIVDPSPRLFVPNVFSPNGDGFNDFFTLFAGVSVDQIDQLTIFDRWGEKVYERRGFPPNDEMLGWDGTFRGDPVQSGVYAYVFTLRLLDGRTTTVSGDVLVLR